MRQRGLVTIEIALMSFVHARADVRVVVPVDRSGLRRVTANLMRRKFFHQPDLVVGVQFDLSEARVSEYPFGLSNVLGFRGFIVAIRSASRDDYQHENRGDEPLVWQATSSIYARSTGQNEQIAYRRHYLRAPTRL